MSADGSLVSISVPTLLMESFGHHIQPPAFVEPYDETCPVCSQMLLDPYQTRCGHRLCKLCLDTHLQENGDRVMCPFNEEDCEPISLAKNDSSVYPDFCLIRTLKKLKVYCDFKYLGCPDTVPWGHLKRHTSSCQYGNVPCPHATRGCEAKCSPGDSNDHVKQCQYAPITCVNCGLPDITTCFMEKHLETCPNVRMTCVHQCGAVMLRNEFHAHLQTCPNKPVLCKYKSMGCAFEGNPEQVKEHKQNEGTHHLDIVTSYCGTLEDRLSNLELNQQALSSSRTASTKTTEETLRQHGQKINRMENIIKETQKTVARHAETIIQQTQALVPRGADSGDTEALKNQLSATAEQLTILSITQSDAVNTLRVLQEQYRAQSLKYSEFDLRFQIIETASYNGVLLWKIENYAQRKADAKRVGGIQSLYSQAFYTSRHGYRMCARVYLNGDGMGLDHHLSLFFVLMRGEFDALLKWPFRQKVTLMLMDQMGQNRHVQDTFRPDPSSSSFQKPKSAMNIASGCPMFISHDVLEGIDSPYLRDNVIFLKIIIDTADISSY